MENGFLAIPSHWVRRALAGILLFVPTIMNAQEASMTGDDASYEKFKQEIRNHTTNPAETTVILKGLNADRQRILKYRAHPEEIEKDLMPLVENMRIQNSSATLMEYAHAQSALKKQLTWLFQYGVVPPVSTGNKIAEAVMDICAEHKKYWPHPNYFAGEVAAKYGNSRKVKDYLFGILQGPPGPERDALLIDLAWSTSFVNDQDLYRILLDLYNGKRERTPPLLAVMTRLNREKALPVLLQEIDTTTDIRTFTQDEDILSQYHRPELLDHPLRRVKDFPRTGWGDIHNPTLGIYSDLLLKYIQNAEGDQLELGLAALEQSVDTLMKSYPVIREKLTSANPASRRATAKFLLRAVNVATFQHPDTVTDIERINQSETDPEIRQTLLKAVRQLRSTPNRHHP
jgi:hypothetical protein